MNKLIVTLGFLCSIQLAAHAQTPALEDVDKLLDFGQITFPELLSPPAITNQTEAIGSTWFYRDYGYLSPKPEGTGIAVAVNISGGGGFNAGEVLAIGGPYGNNPIFVDTLSNLLLMVPDSFGSGEESGIISQGNGNCVDVTPPSGNVLRRYEESIEPSTTIRTEYRFPVRDSSGVTYIGKEETLNNGIVIQSYETEPFISTRISNGLRYLQEERVAYTEVSQVPGNEFTVTTTYSGGLLLGPAYTFCEQQSWYSAPTTKLVTTSPPSNSPGNSTEQTPGSTDTVDSIYDYVTPQLEVAESNVTVPIRTIRTTSVSDEGTTISWLHSDSGILIKEEIYDQDGFLISSKIITSLYISKQ